MKKISYFIITLGVILSLAIGTIGLLGATGAVNISFRPVVNVEFRNYDYALLYATEVAYGSKAEYAPTNVPTRPDKDEFTYIFSDWDKPLDNVQKDTVFIAQYFEEIKDINIKFINYDSSILYQGTIFKGAAAEYYGAKPTRPANDQYKYNFIGWDKPLANILFDTTFKAQYEETKIEYAVTFKNYDDTVLYVDYLTYGESATFQGLNPVKPSTKTENYVFSGWDKNLEYVTQDMETYALFAEKEAVFEVNFINHDKELLYTDYVNYDGTATYLGAQPTRESDDQYTYVFAGWSKALENVRENMTIVATYTKNLKTYAVTFYNYDDTILYIDSVYYGEDAKYLGIEPTRQGDPHFIFEFVGWDRDITNITADLIVYALYDKQIRTFDVVFQNYDGQFLGRQTVEYGANANYDGPFPIRLGDAYTTYKFIGWDKPLYNITEDTIFQAEYEVVSKGGGGAIEIAVVYYFNWDGTLIDGDTLPLYEQSFYYGKYQPPIRPYDRTTGRTFVFDSWNLESELVSVSAYLLLTFAQYRTTNGEICVTYRDAGHNILYEDFIYPGNSSSYGGELYDFLLTENGFTGWSQPLSNVTKCITVYPVFGGGLNE